MEVLEGRWFLMKGMIDILVIKGIGIGIGIWAWLDGLGDWLVYMEDLFMGMDGWTMRMVTIENWMAEL